MAQAHHVSLAHERAGSGPPLLLVHGIGSRRQVWGPVLERLAAEREVVTVDLPGFGESADLPAGVTPTLDAHVDAVVAFLDQQGLDEIDVGGNSMGGGVALELARRGRVRTATALSPIGFWTPQELHFAVTSLRGAYAAARTLQPVAPVIYSTSVGRALGMWQLAARPWRIPAEDAVAALAALAGAPAFLPTLEQI
jgi:pimeloyl-ACP methyl ester carboxylesterase